MERPAPRYAALGKIITVYLLCIKNEYQILEALATLVEFDLRAIGSLAGYQPSSPVGAKLQPWMA